MRAVTGLLVGLHIVSAILGFGAIAATTVLAGVARSRGRSPAVVRYFRPGRNYVAYLALLVPVFGTGLEASSGWPDIGAAWPYVALGIWVVAAGVGTAVHWPAERRIQVLVAVPAEGGAGGLAHGPAPELAPELVAACTRALWSGTVMTLAFFAALWVMLVQ
jgi:hypothetical protein